MFRNVIATSCFCRGRLIAARGSLILQPGVCKEGIPWRDPATEEFQTEILLIAAEFLNRSRPVHGTTGNSVEMGKFRRICT